jgi:alpha-galactosidase
MGVTVEFDAGSRTFLLRTPRSSYAVRVVDGSVRHVHWGAPISLDAAAAIPLRPGGGDGEVVGEEFPGEGGLRFGPPALVVGFGDGARSVSWRYESHSPDGAITLVDEHYPVTLELHYRVHGDCDVIERWAVLHNHGDTPVTVYSFQSGAWTLPRRADYRLSRVAGEWGAEFQLSRVPLPHGESTVTARRGTHRHQTNPWLMVDPGDATEEHGEVWTVALAYSGGFTMTASRSYGDHVAILAGPDHDTAPPRVLGPGERLETPPTLGLYVHSGFGGASREWHSYARRHVLPAPTEARPVLYNSWEGTWFDVDEASQIETARIAADLGVELFVMDDGWFGSRLSDHAGLGDWWPNPDRFPSGLGPLIKEVHRLGMRFGLWVEPEMVNPDSQLYREHPDWVVHQPHRSRTEVRNQLTLNFGRSDVAEWAYEWLSTLLTDNAIDFLKWDMNRPFTEPGLPSTAAHTRNLYQVIDWLRARFPHLRIESCSSGGGRVDFGILRRTDQVWTSDNTDPVDRLAIQHGYSQLYPAAAMGAWASESPNPINGRATPLRFRFHVAMAGALGVSGNLREWSPVDLDEARSLVAQYKRIRHVVAHGDLHRLTPPDAQTVVVQHVLGGESVVIAWRVLNRPGRPELPARLRGLDPDATYDAGERSYPGSLLLAHGLDLDLPRGDHSSTLVHLRQRSA